MKKSTLKVWIVLFIVSMFIILFVNQVKDKETGKNKFEITKNGISGFKKGLDIAGGVRLSYKLDLSKYKETYTNPVEYTNVKKRIEDIIMTNIDNRISKLGVSDYQSYIQTLNEEEFVIIEIGGLKDIDEAKQIIGKTVELEFKIPNEQSTGLNVMPERLALAQNLLKDVKQNPAIFQSLGTGKASEDIYYTHFNGVELSDLPAIYQNSIGKIESISSGSIYDSMLTGTYLSETDSSGQPISVKGWTIVKFNAKNRVVSDVVEPSKLISVSEKNGLKANSSYEKIKLEYGVRNYKYDDSTSVLTYNAGELFSGKAAYDIALYQLSKPNLIGKDASEAEKIKNQSQESVNSVKQDLLDGKIPAYTGAQLVYSGWLDQSSISNYITSFTGDAGTKVMSFDETDGYFVMSIKASKSAQEPLTKIYKVEGISKDKSQTFIDELKVQYLYDIEDIFVKDSPSWIVAKDPKTGEILNGAFFKYANVEQSTLGQPVVSITFDDKGKEIFCNLTEVHVGKQMAIFVGGNLVTSPVIREKICGGTAQIDGSFDNESAKKMTSDLNEGALPAKLILSHEEKISPLLGETAMRGAIIAGAVALVVIFIFMVYMYGIRMGTISLISLILFLVILFAIIKLIGYALSLSAIAAIILSVGMGVDANILIFERINEERKTGKSDYLSVKEGYERSMIAIRDGNFTTGVIGLLLFLVGTNVFKGFGTMMIVNIALTLLVIARSSRDMLLHAYRENK